MEFHYDGLIRSDSLAIPPAVLHSLVCDESFVFVELEPTRGSHALTPRPRIDSAPTSSFLVSSPCLKFKNMWY